MLTWFISVKDRLDERQQQRGSHEYWCRRYSTAPNQADLSRRVGFGALQAYASTSHHVARRQIGRKAFATDHNVPEYHAKAHQFATSRRCHSRLADVRPTDDQRFLTAAERA